MRPDPFYRIQTVAFVEWLGEPDFDDDTENLRIDSPSFEAVPRIGERLSYFNPGRLGGMAHFIVVRVQHTMFLGSTGGPATVYIYVHPMTEADGNRMRGWLRSKREEGAK